MEELYHAKDTRKFYEKLNRLRRGFVPQADMCRDNHGNILMSELELVERRRQHYDDQTTSIATLQAPKVAS
ncbi:hypothetical protein RP20_CCG006140 [Aedes albopictus]|nr:hypothetical protein RP20_CCG006140 [Aedes albopictus]